MIVFVYDGINFGFVVSIWVIVWFLEFSGLCGRVQDFSTPIFVRTSSIFTHLKCSSLKLLAGLSGFAFASLQALFIPLANSPQVLALPFAFQALIKSSFGSIDFLAILVLLW